MILIKQVEGERVYTNCEYICIRGRRFCGISEVVVLLYMQWDESFGKEQELGTQKRGDTTHMRRQRTQTHVNECISSCVRNHH